MRGYFDGDGSITYTKPNERKTFYDYQPSIYIIGTKNLLDVYEHYFLIELGRDCGNKRITRKTWNVNTQAISYAGFNQVKKIFNFMYKDCTVFLTRKLLRFNQFGMYLPAQEEVIRTLERITAELSEEPVKLDHSNRQFEIEGVLNELDSSDAIDCSDTSQTQRIGVDPLSNE